jgi:hypothetical protein
VTGQPDLQQSQAGGGKSRFILSSSFRFFLMAVISGLR